jgi:hypothetical protein
MAPSGRTGADGLIAGSTQEAGHTCLRSQKPVGRDPRSFPPASRRRGRAPWGLKAARLCAVQGALPRKRKHELISRSEDTSRNRFGFGSVSIRFWPPSPDLSSSLTGKLPNEKLKRVKFNQS